MAKLYFYYASMNAGKSTNLLQANFNYGERGMATMLWTAALDNRTEQPIASRIGLGADASRFGPGTNLWEAVMAQHGETPLSHLAYLGDPQLWFESFQNWQSEFLSTAVLVVLSIFLRQAESPESKAVAAPHSQTGA